MGDNRSTRFLTTLGEASTSRVLNLGQVARRYKNTPEYMRKPLFSSPVLNEAFILKQRMRANEAYQFDSDRAMVTKIIAPFDRRDLASGGRSLMVGERGFSEDIIIFGKYFNASQNRDVEVLKILDALPSLDPFLVRQSLANYKIEVAPCYFAISDADQRSMHEFVTAELRQLTTLLGSQGSAESAQRMVTAMLSSDVAEVLAPLRDTLGLTGDAFREGVFSWRGFLYYKWSMARIWPGVVGVLRRIKEIQPAGSVNVEMRARLEEAKNAIIIKVRDSGINITRNLFIYDKSFSELVAMQAPKAFREFLLSAPAMFFELGENLGAISHIVDFWRYRFPSDIRSVADAKELGTIFDDFKNGFCEKMQASLYSVKKPVLIDAR